MMLLCPYNIHNCVEDTLHSFVINKLLVLDKWLAHNKPNLTSTKMFSLEDAWFKLERVGWVCFSKGNDNNGLCWKHPAI